MSGAVQVLATKACVKAAYTGTSKILADRRAVDELPASVHGHVLVYWRAGACFYLVTAEELGKDLTAGEFAELREPVSTAGKIVLFNPALPARRKGAWPPEGKSELASSDSLPLLEWIFAFAGTRALRAEVVETPTVLTASEIVVLTALLLHENADAAQRLAAAAERQLSVLGQEVSDLGCEVTDRANLLRAARISGLQRAHHISVDAARRFDPPADRGQLAIFEQFLGVATRGFACVEMYFHGNPASDMKAELVAEETGHILAEWLLPPGRVAPGWNCLAVRRAVMSLRYGAVLRLTCRGSDAALVAAGVHSLLAAPARINGVAQTAALAMQVWTDVPGAEIAEEGGGVWKFEDAELPVDMRKAIEQISLVGTARHVDAFPLLKAIDSASFQLHPFRGHTVTAALPIEGLIGRSELRSAEITVRSTNSQGAPMMVAIGLCCEPADLNRPDAVAEMPFSAFSGWNKLDPLSSVVVETQRICEPVSHVVFAIKLSNPADTHQFCWTQWSDMRIWASTMRAGAVHLTNEDRICNLQLGLTAR